MLVSALWVILGRHARGDMVAGRVVLGCPSGAGSFEVVESFAAPSSLSGGLKGVAFTMPFSAATPDFPSTSDCWVGALLVRADSSASKYSTAAGRIDDVGLLLEQYSLILIMMKYRIVLPIFTNK